MSADVIEQVALISGRIIHSGTGQPVDGDIRITAREGPVVDKLLDDGTFAVSGRPELLFPKLGKPSYPLNLTIRADSAQYRRGFVEQSLLVSILAGSSFDLPIDLGTILLPADPVNIRGRVVEAQDPETPVPGATVEVLQSGVVTNTTTTDTEGRHRFDEIAVLAPAEIRCSAVGFKTQKRTLLIDFGRLIDEEHFRLAPPP